MAKKSAMAEALEEFEKNNFTFENMSEEEIAKALFLDCLKDKSNADFIIKSLLAKYKSLKNLIFSEIGELSDNIELDSSEAEKIKLISAAFKRIIINRTPFPINSNDKACTKSFVENLVYGDKREKIFILLLEKDKIINYSYVFSGDVKKIKYLYDEIGYALKNFPYNNEIAVLCSRPTKSVVCTPTDLNMAMYLHGCCNEDKRAELKRFFIYGCDGLYEVNDFSNHVKFCMMRAAWEKADGYKGA